MNSPSMKVKKWPSMTRNLDINISWSKTCWCQSKVESGQPCPDYPSQCVDIWIMRTKNLSKTCNRLAILCKYQPTQVTWALAKIHITKYSTKETLRLFLNGVRINAESRKCYNSPRIKFGQRWTFILNAQSLCDLIWQIWAYIDGLSNPAFASGVHDDFFCLKLINTKLNPFWKFFLNGGCD